MAEILFEDESYKIMGAYIPDAICFDKIVLELEAVSEITNKYRAQVHNYLKATGYRLGIIVNFGHHPKLQYERIVR